MINKNMGFPGKKKIDEATVGDHCVDAVIASPSVSIVNDAEECLSESLKNSRSTYSN